MECVAQFASARRIHGFHPRYTPIEVRAKVSDGGEVRERPFLTHPDRGAGKSWQIVFFPLVPRKEDILFMRYNARCCSEMARRIG